MNGLPAPLGERRLGDAALIVLCSVAMAATAGTAAFATRDLFASLQSDRPLAVLSLGQLAACGIVIPGLRMLSRIAAERLAQGFAMSLRRTLFAHLSCLPPSYINGQRTGSIGLRFVGDLSAARGWAGRGLPRALAAAIVLPGAAIAAYLLNPVLAAAMALPLSAAVIAMAASAGRLEPLHRRLRRERSRIASGMLERAAVAPELAMIGRTKRELQRLDRLGGELRGLAIRRVRSLATINALPEMASAIAGVSIFWTAGQYGVAGPETAGALALLAILSLPLRELAGVWDKRCAWIAARERYLELLSVAPSLGRRTQAKPVAIAFDRVRHRAWAIDLAVAAGDRVVIDDGGGGAAGELLNIAAALEPAEQGRVRFAPDDRPPRTLFINRRAPILKGSLRRALTLGAARRPDDREITCSAEFYGLSHMLQRSGGLDSSVGEAGRDLAALDRLRILCCRGELIRPALILIETADLPGDRSVAALIRGLAARTSATILIADNRRDIAQLNERRWVFADGCWVDAAGGNGLEVQFEAA